MSVARLRPAKLLQSPWRIPDLAHAFDFPLRIHRKGVHLVGVGLLVRGGYGPPSPT